jgi:BetI-type transcriptional repressor, C-terminal
VIFAAVLRAVTEIGPVRMTLADVAKRALLLAFASQGADGSRGLFDGLRAAHRSPLAQLLGMADCMAQMGSTPEQISNTLAFLQIDLTDPEFHRFALQSSGQTYEGIRQLVADAIAAGELRRCPAARLARALQATMNGSLLNWAIHREGDLRAWIRRDLGTVLAPWRQPRTPRARRSTARSRAGGPRSSRIPVEAR